MTRKHIAIIATLMLAEVTSAFEQSAALAGLAQWIRDYKDPVAVGWIVTAYMLVAASAAAICGRLGDIYGRKLMLLLVLGACTIGSIISALGFSLTWIIVGRAIQGVAGAIVPLCYAIAREHLPKEQVPSVIGMIVAVAGAGATIGLLCGGLLTDAFGANSVFWASAILSVVAATVTIVVLPRSGARQPDTKIDFVGGILFAPSLVAILLGFGNIDSEGWTHWSSGGLIVLGGVVALFWVLYELRHDNPLIDVRLLTKRNILMGNIILACLAVGPFQLLQLLSLLVQQPVWTAVGLGLSATAIGLIRLPNLVSSTVSSVLSGWVSGRLGPRTPMMLGTVIVVAGLAFAAFQHDSLTMIFVISIVTSIGMTMAYAAVPNVILASTPPERTGEVAGLMSVIRAISRAVGAQVLVLLLATSTVTDPASQVKYPDDAAYTLVFLVMAALGAASLILTFFLPRDISLNPKEKMVAAG